MVKWGILSLLALTGEGCFGLTGNVSLGARLRAARKAAGVSAERAGKATGVKPNAVYKWENGQSDPNATQLLALCRLYGIDFEYLYDPESDHGPSAAHPWETGADVRVLVADVVREHPGAYPILVKDSFADSVLPLGSYAFVEPVSGSLKPGTLCAVSIDDEYPVFARTTALAAGYRLAPDSRDPTKRELIIDFDEEGDANVLGEVIWHFPPCTKNC